MAAMTTTPIIALDTPTLTDALALVDRIGPRCSFYKVGSELFTAEGPRAVQEIVGRGIDVFLDLKFHDIPNTVASAVRRAATLGARLVTIHAVGGETMTRAAVAAAREHECRILAVTVLTSLDDAELGRAWGRPDRPKTRDEVLRLAELAAMAGAYGVVCSGQEVAAVRERFGESLAALVPGVRLLGDAAHDQARVVTPSAAAALGARYIVLGRTVSAAAEPEVAMDRVLAELTSVSSDGVPQLAGNEEHRDRNGDAGARN